MADTEQGGTPNPSPDDAPSGTPGQVADDATTVDWEARAKDLERKFEQSLREKDHLEEERRRRRELEEENERLKSGGYGTAPATAGNPYAQAAEEMRQYYFQLQQSDDPRDKMTLANLAYTQRLEAQIQFNTELASIPKDDQAAVEKRSKDLGIRPSLAYQSVKGERYDKEKADLDERRRKLDEDEAARRKGRVDTTTVPIPARDFSNGKYSPEQLARDAEAAELYGNAEARKRVDDFNSGRLRYD